MKRFVLIILFFVLSFSTSAQEADRDNIGTIRVQKKGQLVKIQFDDVNYRLVGIDQYGNVLDSAVMEFQMSVTIKGVFYYEKTVGFALSYEMQRLLGRCDSTSKIFFENVKAKDRSGNLLEMPKFQYNYGYTNENTE